MWSINCTTRSAHMGEACKPAAAIRGATCRGMEHWLAFNTKSSDQTNRNSATCEQKRWRYCFVDRDLATLPDPWPGDQERTVCFAPIPLRKTTAAQPARKCCLSPWCCWLVYIVRICSSGTVPPAEEEKYSCWGTCGYWGTWLLNLSNWEIGSVNQEGLVGKAELFLFAQLKQYVTVKNQRLERNFRH